MDEGLLSKFREKMKKTSDGFTKEEALKNAKKSATSAGDPMHELVMRHKKAKLAALKEINYACDRMIKQIIMLKGRQ